MSKEQRTKNKKSVFITKSFKQTQELGGLLAEELRGGHGDTGGEVICLTGELGSGKTTFAQGVLRGLGIKGPHTSPTFLVMKHYEKEIPNPKSQIRNKSQSSKSKFSKIYKIPNTRYQIRNIYHIDAYRVGPKDILDLGWEEIINNKKNIIIVEWAERIRRIIPKNAIWVKFSHRGKDEREIRVKTKYQSSNDKSSSKLKIKN